MFNQAAGEPAHHKQPCNGTPDDRQSDLCAQWKAADWTKWGVLIGILGTIALIYQIMLTRAALKDTGQATEAMREANEIARDDIRPIMAFDGIDWEVFQGPHSQFARFRWRNIGLRPARLIKLEIGREQAAHRERPDFKKMLATFAAKQRDRVGLTIGPDRESVSTPVAVTSRDFQNPLEGNEARKDVYLLARVIYASALIGEHKKEFSTLIAVQVLPVVEMQRPATLPANEEWQARRTRIMGPLDAPVVGFEIAIIDDPDAVQMT